MLIPKTPLSVEEKAPFSRIRELSLASRPLTTLLLIDTFSNVTDENASSLIPNSQLLMLQFLMVIPERLSRVIPGMKLGGPKIPIVFPAQSNVTSSAAITIGLVDGPANVVSVTMIVGRGGGGGGPPCAVTLIVDVVRTVKIDEKAKKFMMMIDYLFWFGKQVLQIAFVEL